MIFALEKGVDDYDHQFTPSLFLSSMQLERTNSIINIIVPRTQGRGCKQQLFLLVQRVSVLINDARTYNAILQRRRFHYIQEQRVY